MISIADHSLAHGNSVVHRIDPRYRLLCALGTSLWVAATPRPAALSVALAGALLLTLVARIPAQALVPRLLALNGFMVLALFTLPFSVPGEPIIRIGSLAASLAGLEKAFAILLAGNTLMLLLTALVATIEPVTLGHALWHLRVPEKLVRILMFAIRYIDVLHQSRLRIARAMRARGYQPRIDAHTLRTTAFLVSALVAESVTRAQRVEQAMRCRGWRGRFYVLNHFRATARDGCFLALFAACLLAAGVLL